MNIIAHVMRKKQESYSVVVPEFYIECSGLWIWMEVICQDVADIMFWQSFFKGENKLQPMQTADVNLIIE